MKRDFTAVIKQEDDWWVGWIEEIPGVNCQEPTRDLLLETLAVTLEEAIELNREEAIAAAGEGFTKETIAV
jgi:predicted RNase H-like HicB family nuclease